MRVIVIGGGIGGLATAVALRRAGLEPAVFERAGGLRAEGAGISLWVNAVRALGKLGLGETIRDLGAELGGEVRSWRGSLLAELPAEALRRRFGGTNLALGRADLQAALLAALPDGTVRLGARFVGFTQDAGGVVARFADGTEARGDLLVGADGLHSSVRACLFGDEKPRYAGYTAWRGIAEPERALVPEGAGVNLLGPGMEFGLANIGRGRLYWFATRNAPEGAPEGRLGRKRGVLDSLRGWYAPARAAVEATAETDILRTDIYDRKPLGGRWGKGRVTLLGDAAHPMTPNLGQGACQAIEDAVVLAASLKERRDEGALKLYEERRAARTAMIVRRSRLLGRWFYQLENPALWRLRNAALKAIPPGAELRHLDPILGYEA